MTLWFGLHFRRVRKARWTYIWNLREYLFENGNFYLGMCSLILHCSRLVKPFVSFIRVINEQTTHLSCLFSKKNQHWPSAWNFQLSYLTFCIWYEQQVINVQVPFLFKLAIDWLAALGGAEASLASFTETNATLLALFASPAAVLIGYGIARSGVSACTGIHLPKSSRISFFLPLLGTHIITFCSP